MIDVWGNESFGYNKSENGIIIEKNSILIVDSSIKTIEEALNKADEYTLVKYSKTGFDANYHPKNQKILGIKQGKETIDLELKLTFDYLKKEEITNVYFTLFSQIEHLREELEAGNLGLKEFNAPFLHIYATQIINELQKQGQRRKDYQEQLLNIITTG